MSKTKTLILLITKIEDGIFGGIPTNHNNLLLIKALGSPAVGGVDLIHAEPIALRVFEVGIPPVVSLRRLLHAC